MVMMMTSFEEIPQSVYLGHIHIRLFSQLRQFYSRTREIKRRLCDDTNFHTAERAYGSAAAGCTKPAHTTQVVRIKR